MSVAKWLRQWVVISLFAGSSPVTRLILKFNYKILLKKIYIMSRYLGPKLKINRKLGELPGLTKKKIKKNQLFRKK